MGQLLDFAETTPVSQKSGIIHFLFFVSLAEPWSKRVPMRKNPPF